MNEADFIDLLDEVISDAKSVAEAYEFGSGMRSAQRILDDSRDAVLGEYNRLLAKLEKAKVALGKLADDRDSWCIFGNEDGTLSLDAMWNGDEDYAYEYAARALAELEADDDRKQN